MKRFTITALAPLALLAVGAAIAASASAVEGYLPLEKKGTTFEANTSTFATTAGTAIICKKLDPSKGEWKDDTHITLTFHWLECASSGLSVQSLGAKAGEVLVEILVLVCLIEPIKLIFGMFAEITGGLVHLEIPAVGTLIKITGNVVGEILAKAGEKSASYKVDFTGEKGKQNQTACKDEKGIEKKASLTWEQNEAKAAEAVSLNIGEEKTTFEEKVELMDK